ncbi:hypothetical protein MNBD_GAMMA12-116 [hydrothermal vent metagenome]|uniref:Periplasmic chaperone PpiD n=1 Tax=hydrothermal vent metagenome TaxID=652676 RepID=A0A3B0Y0Y3_9ZZZZ
MLQAIRDKATGLVAMLIIGLIIVVFALWGIESWIGEPAVPIVAKVNGTSITMQDFENEFQHSRLSQYTLKHGAPNVKKTRELKRQFLTEKVDGIIRLQAAETIGYYYSQAQIEAELRRSEGYSRDKYNGLLAQAGVTLEADLAQRQKRIYNEQFNYVIRQAEFFTNSELLENWKMQHRTIEFSYVTIPAKSFYKDIKITEQQLKEYYTKNKKQFMIPASVQFSYVELGYKQFTKIPKVTDIDISKDYAKYKNGYREPSVRKASHLLVKVDKNAPPKKVAAALKKINEAYAQLAQRQNLRRTGEAPIKVGRLFKRLVKKYSDDKFVPGVVIDPIKQKALYDALNNVPLSVNSKPVRGEKGFYILYLTNSKAGKIRPVEDVKELIRNKLLRFKAIELYGKKVEILNAQVFENSETLEVAASILKLGIKTTAWFKKGDKYTGVLALPKVRTEAFGKDVYANGDVDASVNSRTININSGKPTARTIVIRLSKYKRSSFKTFEQVKVEVTSLLRNELARTNAKKLGENLIKELKLKPDFNAMSKNHAWIVTKSGSVNRFNTKIPSRLIKSAFSLGVPVKDKKYAGSVQLANNDFVVFILEKSTYGTMSKVNAQTKKIYQLGNAAMMSEVLLQNTLDLLRKNASVVLKSHLIESSNDEN